MEFDGCQGGLLEAPLYPLTPGISSGPPGFSGWPGPSGPPRNSTTDHDIVLTMGFKLVSFFTFILFCCYTTSHNTQPVL